MMTCGIFHQFIVHCLSECGAKRKRTQLERIEIQNYVLNIWFLQIPVVDKIKFLAYNLLGS